MRILITGGPGSGCTSTAKRIGDDLNVQVIDSDTFFHKPTDPPFQEQYTPDERRERLSAELSSSRSWILSGSIATWGLELETVQFGVFLGVPKEERMQRLIQRERERFGTRIDFGGDLHDENQNFMLWAGDYEMRRGKGRNRNTDLEFLCHHCERFFEIEEVAGMDQIAFQIHHSLNA